jgi:hypothetical protein
MYTPCCDDKSHCIGTDTSEFVKATIESTVGLRKHIQDGLIKAGVTDFVVPDLLQQILDEKADFVAMGEKLRPLMCKDGIHMTKIGYEKMADVVLNTIEKCKSAAVSIVSGAGAVPRPSFFWRGFMSPVGSVRIRQGATTYKQARNGGGKWKGGAQHGGNPNMGAGRGRGGNRTSFYTR